jgi:hypothetical protein
MHCMSKISVALVALLAAAGEARNHHGHFRRRQFGNDTAANPATLTQFETKLITITSCAPTVTDCPADSTIVTSTVVPVETTGEAAPLETAAPTKVSNTTLTYTLGTGSSMTVVTTTIFQTSTFTNLLVSRLEHN